MACTYLSHRVGFERFFPLPPVLDERLACDDGLRRLQGRTWCQSALPAAGEGCSYRVNRTEPAMTRGLSKVRDLE